MIYKAYALRCLIAKSQFIEQFQVYFWSLLARFCSVWSLFFSLFLHERHGESDHPQGLLYALAVKRLVGLFYQARHAEKPLGFEHSALSKASHESAINAVKS